MPDTSKIFSFLREIEGVHKIERVMYLSDHSRRETDSEHMWHMAVFILCFAHNLPKEVDQLKLLKLALTHDIVELYAGDTFAFDKQGRENKTEREKQAAKKLYSKLPSPLQEEFLNLFEEFEDKQTLEARYAQSFDKLQALFMDYISKSKALKDNNISSKQLRDYSGHLMAHDSLMNELYEDLMTKLKQDGLE